MPSMLALLQALTPEQRAFLGAFLIEFAKWVLLGIISWGIRRLLNLLREIPTKADLVELSTGVTSYFDKRMSEHDAIEVDRFSARDKRQDATDARLEAIKIQLDNRFSARHPHAGD